MATFIATKQRPIRASFNCSSIVPDQLGKNQAVEWLFTHLAKKCSVTDLFSKVDVSVLNGVKIAEEIAKEVQAVLDDDPDPNQSTEALLSQAKEVLDFCANRQNRLREKTDLAVREFFGTQVEQIFFAARQVINEDPMLVEPVVEKITDAADEFATKTFSFDYQRRLRHGCKGLQELQIRHDPPIVPTAVGKKLSNSVFSALGRIVGTAVEQKIAHLIDEYWLQIQEQEFRPRIEKLRQSAQRSTEAQQAILEYLVKTHQLYAEQTRGKESNGVIKLPALARDQVIDLLNKHDVDLESGFRSQLISDAKKDYPLATATNGASTTLPEVYPNLPPEFVGACFQSFIDRLVASKLTVYKLVKGSVESIVQKAHELASPLIDLQGRAIPQLNVQPTSNVIISFPESHDSDDSEVRQQMEKHFLKIEPKSALTDAPAGCNEITVTRLLAGFPASCMGHLGDQRDSYESARSYNHLMHIPGFASSDGKALGPNQNSSPEEGRGL